MQVCKSHTPHPLTTISQVWNLTLHKPMIRSASLQESYTPPSHNYLTGMKLNPTHGYDQECKSHTPHPLTTISQVWNLTLHTPTTGSVGVIVYHTSLRVYHTFLLFPATKLLRAKFLINEKQWNKLYYISLLLLQAIDKRLLEHFLTNKLTFNMC